MTASKPEPPPEEGEERVRPFLDVWLMRRVGTGLAVGAAQDLVYERVKFGREKYGTELMTHNGRDPVEDARQELGDLLMYIAQAKMEGRDVSELKTLLKVVTELV